MLTMKHSSVCFVWASSAGALVCRSARDNSLHCMHRTTLVSHRWTAIGESTRSIGQLSSLSLASSPHCPLSLSLSPLLVISHSAWYASLGTAIYNYRRPTSMATNKSVAILSLSSFGSYTDDNICTRRPLHNTRSTEPERPDRPTNEPTGQSLQCSLSGHNQSNGLIICLSIYRPMDWPID